MTSHTDLTQALLDRYRAIGLTPPPWSWDFRPSIPFVGIHYEPGGILVYASAENLSYYERNPEDKPTYMTDERALDRHRAANVQASGAFFSNIHIQPFNDGKLIIALQYYLAKHHQPKEIHRNPKRLLERIAAANFSKFSIKGEVDRDIAGNMNKLRESMAYVSADLEVLKPAVVIMPRSIFKHEPICEMIRRISPATKVIALPQFTPQVANIHLSHHAKSAARLCAALRGSMLQKWIDRVPGYKPGNFHRFLIELDQELKR